VMAAKLAMTATACAVGTDHSRSWRIAASAVQRTLARRWPRAVNCSSLDGQILTMANSAATKKALTKTSAILASMATA